MDDIDIAYSEFEKLSMEHEPLTSAGVMMAQALKIYKAVLSDDEYEMMTKAILERGNEIVIERPTLQ